MRKFIVPLILLIIFTAILTGCSSEITFPIDVECVESPSYTDKFEMEFVGESVKGGFTYWRDAATDVIYIRFQNKSGYAGMGGLTAMLDPKTGLPLTYARYMELYNNISA